MLGIGLLGAGRIGRIHGGNIAAHPRARLLAVADVDAKAAKALADAAGARAATVEAVLADRDIDAVVVCTPTDTHAGLIERAVERHKGRLMIGFNRRFDPSFATLRRRVAKGEIGDVELVSIVSKDPSPPHEGYLERSGGLFRDMMIHDLDMARFLLGEEPAEVHAVGSALVHPMFAKARDFDTGAVILRTASGRIAQIANSRRATYGYDQRIEVHGSKGMLTAGNWRATTVEFADARGYVRDPVLPFFLERYADAYRAELDAFVAGVLDRKPLSPAGADGLAAQMLADAATKSAHSGRPVALRA
jgi:myo-inositol 2-dehydrogenase/D-chiro-inositol 1-dehydrogenase